MIERLGETEKAVADRDEVIKGLKDEASELNSRIETLNMEYNVLFQRMKTVEQDAVEEVN